MEFFVRLALLGPKEAVAMAQVVEAAGFDGVSLADHLVFPQTLEANYPYNSSGLPGHDLTLPLPDVFVTVAAMACVTQRLKFVTNVYVLPLRHPIVAAKALSTASILADGRLAFGVGIGWMPEEFASLGLDFTQRGRMMDEALVAVRSLLEPGSQTFEGEFYSFGPVFMNPTPTQRVPVLVGGSSGAALGRAARVADGYMAAPAPMTQLIETVREAVRLRRELRPDDLADFVVHGRATDATRVDDYLRLADAGVTSFNYLPPTPFDGSESELRADLERFIETIAAPVTTRLGTR